MSVNQGQREQWNAESQAKTWPRRERITIAVTPKLLAALALRPGERVLEIGSGGGLAALDAARAVGPSGAVTGFDLSAPLVGLAKQRADEARLTNVSFVAGDAQTDAIPNAPFDVAMSQFGVMFFADPVAAFANIRKHLRSGARVAFACWQGPAKNAWFPGPVLAPYAPPPQPPEHGGPPPGPFAFADQAYVEKVLAGAGFRDIRGDDLSLPVTIPDDSLFDRETLDSLRIEDCEEGRGVVCPDEAPRRAPRRRRHAARRAGPAHCPRLQPITAQQGTSKFSAAPGTSPQLAADPAFASTAYRMPAACGMPAPPRRNTLRHADHGLRAVQPDDVDRKPIALCAPRL